MSDPDPADSTSLSEHEQAFVSPEPAERPQADPAPPPAPAPVPVAADLEPDDEATSQRKDESRDGERDEHGRFKQRAQSQRATPADVDKINEYTKRLRAAEDAVGLKIEKQPGESERVFQLRRRAEIAEAIRDRKAQPQAPPPPPVPRPPAPPTAFTEKEPQYEDFADQPDQYAAHLRAVAAYDRRKDAFEYQQTQAKTEQQRGIEERNARRDQFFRDSQAQHYQRMATFHQANPHAQAILDAAGDNGVTPAMMMAIMTSEQGPQMLLTVAQDEALRDDLIDLTEGKPLTKDLVARVQRRLSRGLTDAQTTGSSPVPLKPVPLVPRPPTPVRTGPMKPADSPPGDDAPLSAHEAAYGSPRRRR